MKKIINSLKRFAGGLSANNINAHAAASAFYMFLSLVPFVALISAVIPYTGLRQEALLSAISSYIPDALNSLIHGIVNDIYFSSDLVLPVTLIVTIWLSSRAFSSLIRGLEVIFQAPKYSSYLKRSLRACLYTVGIIAAMLLVLAVWVFGRQIYFLLNSEFQFISPFLTALLKLRFLLIIIILSLVFMGIYHWTPGTDMKFFSLLPGSIAASGAWLLFSWLFSLFIRYGNGYSTYGSLATIIISLLWMYWCMYFILAGAYLNFFLNNRYNEKASE